MYRIVLPFIFFFSLTIDLFSQISNEQELQIKNYIQTQLITNKLKKEVKQKADAENILNAINGNSISSPVSYENLSSILNNNHFEGTKSKILDNIHGIKIHSTESVNAYVKIFFDSLEIKLNATQKTDLGFTNDKEKLQKEILDFFNPKEPQAPVQQPNNNIESNSIATSEQKSVGFFSLSNFNFWSLLPLVCALGILLYLIKSLNEINNRIERRVKKEDFDSLNFNQSKQSNTTLNSNDKLISNAINNSSAISDLNTAISNLQIRIVELEKGNTASNQNNNFVQSASQVISENIFYMMKPVDNYFLDSNKSSSKNETAYKFIVHKNNIEADFEIHLAGNLLNDIIKRSESYIKPACNEDNVPNNNVSNIITKKKGLVSLQDGKWIIKEKALIRYE